jgi:iron complex transport system ATP-binding protein
MSTAPSLIELENVCIERGSTRILDHIHLEIPQGEHIAILGPNGSGKSTLLKLLLKFFYPSVVDGVTGTAKILGREEWNVWELRAQLGFVSSEIDHHFCVGRSARLNAIQTILTGFSSSELEPDWNTISPAMTAEAHRLLSLFCMESISRKPVGTLSTGERRRVLLARAMVMHPKAIVLDEPTSGLDLLARAKFLEQVHQLAQSGTQIVLVTHHLEEILPCIERTVMLKAGAIFFDGRTVDAITNDRVSGLFGARLRIDRDANGFHYAVLASLNGEN